MSYQPEVEYLVIGNLIHIALYWIFLIDTRCSLGCPGTPSVNEVKFFKLKQNKQKQNPGIATHAFDPSTSECRGR